ncbi:MAG: hypothetical protein O2964_03700 [Verrucomicrobia bacterium]|nr:hypothetical protein [Verrucomicrobiota bacterium]
MALAQFERKSEAPDAYHVAISTAVERMNATEDMIQRCFSECASWLQEKGYLSAE